MIQSIISIHIDIWYDVIFNICYFILYLYLLKAIQSINQSTNQPTNQSTNQPINQSTNQPINQSIKTNKTEEQMDRFIPNRSEPDLESRFLESVTSTFRIDVYSNDGDGDGGKMIWDGN